MVFIQLNIKFISSKIYRKKRYDAGVNVVKKKKSKINLTYF
jgi:hypothetical protein